MGDEQTASLTEMRRDLGDIRAEVGQLRDRVTRIETRGEAVAETLISLKARFDTIDAKLDVVAVQIARGVGGVRVGAWMLHGAFAIIAAAGGWIVGGGRH